MGGSVFPDCARRILVLIPLALCAVTSAADAQGRTRNVVLVTLDGVRTEEVFGGLDVDVLRSTIGEARDPTDTEAYQPVAEVAVRPDRRGCFRVEVGWRQGRRS